MNQYEMVVAIVVVAMLAGIIKWYLRFKAMATPFRDPMLDARLEKLEDRIKALEAITTDPRNRVRKQISEL